LIGGVEKFLLDLIKNLNRKKFDITVVALSGSGPLYEEFRKNDIPIFFSSSKKIPNSIIKKLFWLFSTPVNFLRITLFLKKEKPDIIINSMYKADIFSLFYQKKEKVISIQHDMAEINPFLRYLKIRALRKNNKIIAISNNVKDFLINFFHVDSSKIEVIYNGIDFEKFLSLQKNDDKWQPVFGVIARLEKNKGHIYLLDALKRLKDEGKYPQFIFIGDGKERTEIECFLRKYKLNNVEMLGLRENIEDIMKKIDVFVSPSLSEGLGISLIEALVAKKLVIASNIGGIKELIKKDQTGILVEPTNIDDLYSSINWVLENKEKAISLRNLSFSWINKNKHLFDIKNVSEKYSQIFDELIKKN
jgi:glycosyltransferase involved in cell wall biosynthesis